MTTILLVGAADTGRTPMAVALLRRLLEHHGLSWSVSSAGVLGHDEAPPEIEARDVMAHLGLDISEHHARSIEASLVDQANLLVAIDSGTARVLQARFSQARERIHTLGALAGRQRDIPDPFRMQIGAWLTYAHELEALLSAAIPRMVELVPTEAVPPSAPAPYAAAVERLERLLGLAIDMPGVLDWGVARAQISSVLDAAGTPAHAADLAPAYTGLLRAALALSSNPPTPGQLAALQRAIGCLARPVAQEDLNQLSARLAAWVGL